MSKWPRINQVYQVPLWINIYMGPGRGGGSRNDKETYARFFIRILVHPILYYFIPTSIYPRYYHYDQFSSDLHIYESRRGRTTPRAGFVIFNNIQVFRLEEKEELITTTDFLVGK